MKRILSCIAFVGLIALVSCGGDSPTAKPVPTVVPEQWAISFVANPTSTFVNSVVALTANATVSGGAAPDGTIVTFTYPYLDDPDNNPDTAVIVYLTKQVTTEDGVAVAYFSISRADTYTVSARVKSVERALNVTFTDRATSITLEIYDVLPREGAFDGGEQVILRGKAIASPVEVEFEVDGEKFIADVVSVQESVPLSAAGQIIIRTPFIGGVDRSTGQTATLEVRGGVGTTNEQEYTVVAGYTYLAEHELQIYNIDPRSGSYDGGETVVLTGRGIRAPARVTFTLVDGEDEDLFLATVQNVVESMPLNAEGSIVIETPFIPEGKRPFDPVLGLQINHVDVLVEVGIDQPNVLEHDLRSAYTYTPQGSTVPEVWRLEEPSMYILIDDFGSNQGGETVTILGRNFRAQKYGTDGVTVVDTAPAVTSVKFGVQEAQILSVSQDGTQVEVVAPRYQVLPLEQDIPVSVALVTEFPLAVDPGPYPLSKTNGYVYLADRPTPVITSLSPIAGPLDGGTLVTITGHGFQFPVQVTFGDLAAEEVNLFDDQTLADNDLITCISPDYAQQNEVPPVAVEVEVRNIDSGKISNTETFTYGDNLYITGNTPTEGHRGEVVIIYGSGFEDPLQVDFSTGLGVNTRLGVISVSGTELTVKFPDEHDPVCTSISGSFIVTLLEREGTDELGIAEGGFYTYLGNRPIVTSVDPRFVQSYNDGDDVTPTDVTIFGVRFGPGIFVEIGSFRMDSADITLIDDQTIDLINLPAWNDFNLPADWHRTECLTDLGELGERLLPTPVNVTVTNIPENCADTLIGAIIYEPESDACLPPAFAMQVTPIQWNFTADLEVGTFTVTNSGLNPIDLIATITLESTPGVFTISTAQPIPALAAGASTTVDVTITAVPAQVDTGELTIDGSDGLGGTATFILPLTETVP